MIKSGGGGGGGGGGVRGGGGTRGDLERDLKHHTFSQKHACLKPI